MDETPNFTPTPIPTEHDLATFDHRMVPSPVEVIGDVRVGEPTLSGLPPEMRERVNAKLASVTPGNRDIFERQFIREELEANSYRLKVLAGPGQNANEYQRESFGIMREIYDLESEAARIEAELEEVGYRTAHDDEGAPIAVPVYRFAPETMQGRRQALQDVRYRLAQVEREAPARRTEAARRTQERIAQQNEQLEIQARAEAKASDILKQEEIDRRAAAFAANRRNTFL